MSTVGMISELRKMTDLAKAQKMQAISILQLDEWLDLLEADYSKAAEATPVVDSEVAWKRESALRLRLAANEAANAAHRKMIDSVISTGTEARRAAFLANGGAAAATLAFIGPMLTSQIGDPRQFAWALGCFCIGVVLIVFGKAADYFSQACFEQQMQASALEDSRRSASWGELGNFWLGLFFTLSGGSYFALVAGFMAAVFAFANVV